ncbi:Ribosome-recycling factor, chloroplastic [Zea mays]|uniref:Ribosome-recycling factor, chloroplastic n=1 Tax=Zea mays TaxID=4577 RepID=A0A3L6F0F2_MAIZE|nr:Ribosome-recycling factor, chloroplastic [Zea mays]
MALHTVSPAAVSSLLRALSRSLPQRPVLMHATTEEIEAEKSFIEDQALLVCLQKEKMEKAIETVQANFNTVRTGRANPAMLDRIEVEYYRTLVNLKSIAQISTPDATSLLNQPYDKSSHRALNAPPLYHDSYKIANGGFQLAPNAKSLHLKPPLDTVVHHVAIQT